MRLIDADALIETLINLKPDGFSNSVAGKATLMTIEKAPTVDSVKPGRWYIDPQYWSLDGYINKPYQCSECKNVSDNTYEYCPHCGSKNDGVSV